MRFRLREDDQVVAMLISSARESSWRIDISDFGSWLQSRWPGMDSSVSGVGQRAHVWIWPDAHEVWVPVERDCAWIEADEQRICAVAAWLAATSADPLILCDEGYASILPLEGATESSLLARLRDQG